MTTWLNNTHQILLLDRVQSRDGCAKMAVIKIKYIDVSRLIEGRHIGVPVNLFGRGWLFRNRTINEACIIISEEF